MRAPVFLLSASRQNLGRLLLIRILVLAAQAGSVGFAWLSDLLPLPWLALGLTLGLSACLILFTALRLRAPWPVTDQEYAVQLACDLIIHSTLLYYSGGSTNPFVSYYLVPLTIAAATLPWIYSMVLSGLALTGYTLLLIWYHPLHLQAVQHEAMLINLHPVRHVAELRPVGGLHHLLRGEDVRGAALAGAHAGRAARGKHARPAVARGGHPGGRCRARTGYAAGDHERAAQRAAPGAPAGPDPAGRPGIAPGTGQAVQAHHSSNWYGRPRPTVVRRSRSKAPRNGWNRCCAAGT